jgi:hypothetical protein
MKQYRLPVCWIRLVTLQSRDIYRENPGGGQTGDVAGLTGGATTTTRFTLSLPLPWVFGISLSNDFSGRGERP